MPVSPLPGAIALPQPSSSIRSRASCASIASATRARYARA